jgi:hypothetical protein
MIKLSSVWLYALVIAVTFSSCDLVGGLIEFGFYTAIIFIVLLVALILWIVRRMRR